MKGTKWLRWVPAALWMLAVLSAVMLNEQTQAKYAAQAQGSAAARVAKWLAGELPYGPTIELPYSPEAGETLPQGVTPADPAVQRDPQLIFGGIIANNKLTKLENESDPSRSISIFLCNDSEVAAAYVLTPSVDWWEGKDVAGHANEQTPPDFYTIEKHGVFTDTSDDQAHAAWNGVNSQGYTFSESGGVYTILLPALSKAVLDVRFSPLCFQGFQVGVQMTQID